MQKYGVRPFRLHPFLFPCMRVPYNGTLLPWVRKFPETFVHGELSLPVIVIPFDRQ